jgi:hypothetical protein
MKAGFFFQEPVSSDLLLSIANQNNLELVGTYFKNKEGLISSNPIIYDSEDELLVQIEIAFIFFDSSNYFDFTAKALRRGVNVFLASLPDYSYSTLLEMNELSFEIGIPIGFGCAGDTLIKQDEIIGNYFMLQLTRDAGMTINNDIFRRMMVYDVASFVRIKPCGLRKFRVNSLPLFTKTPKAINLRMEYDNSSVIASSITRVNEPERCVLRFFSGDDGYFKDLPCINVVFSDRILNSPESLLTDENFIANFNIYTQEILSKTPLSFGIENAIETLHIVESIEDRIYPMN